MALTETAIEVKFVARNSANSEFRRIADDLGRIAAAARGVNASFSRFKNIGGFMAGAAREASNFNRELRLISLSAENSTQNLRKMYDDMYTNSQRTGIRKEALLGGHAALSNFGLNNSQINSVMQNVADAMIVSRATSEQAANAVMIASRNFGFNAVDDSAQILNKMYIAGKSGSLGIENLPNILEKIGAAGQRAGMSFDEILAFSETMADFNKKSPESAGAMGESILKIFDDERLQQSISRHAGVAFFNEDGSRRNAFDVMGGLQQAYQSMESDRDRQRFINKTFGDANEATRNNLIKFLSGDLSRMSDLREEIAAQQQGIAEDMELFTSNFGHQLNRLKKFFERTKTSAGDIFGDLAKEPIKLLADNLEGKDFGKLLFGGVAAAGIASLIAGGIGAFKGLKPGARLFGSAGNLAANMAKYEVLSKVTDDVQKVFVMNMPDGFGGGIAPALPSLGLPRGARGRALPKGAKGAAAGKVLPKMAAAGKSALGLAATAGKGALGLAPAALPVAAVAAAAAAPAIGIWGVYKALTDQRSADERKRERDAINPRIQSMIDRGIIEAPQVNNEVRVNVFLDSDGRLIDTKIMEERQNANSGDFSALF